MVPVQEFKRARPQEGEDCILAVLDSMQKQQMVFQEQQLLMLQRTNTVVNGQAALLAEQTSQRERLETLEHNVLGQGRRIEALEQGPSSIPQETASSSTADSGRACASCSDA